MIKILPNQEVLRKSQNWVETQPSPSVFPPEMNFRNYIEKIQKSRSQSFLLLSNFDWFSAFGYIFLTGL